MAELKNACLASRGFYELITSNPSSIKRFILKVGPEFIHAGYRTLLEALLQSDRVFESMYIDVGLADTEALYNKNLLLEVVKKFGPQIKEITIKDFPANFKSHDVLNLLPNIVSATVIGCVMSLTQYSQKNLTLPFNNLKILKVENSAISSFNHTKTLQYISYKMQNNDVLNLIPLPVTTIFNEILSSNQATIKTLIVTGNVFNENNYSGLNLLHLSLNYPLLNQMVIKNMANFLSHQNELQHLSIALDFSIGADLVKVVMQMRQLKSLEINYPEIGDNFNHIYVNPNLDSLVLKNISDRGWSSYTVSSYFDS